MSQKLVATASKSRHELTLPEAWAQEIRESRIRLGLSRPEFAARLGYSTKQLVRWETGANAPKLPVLDAIRRLAHRENESIGVGATASDFTFVDLFAGIGGLRKGFEAVGGSCIFTSEWDNKCLETYRANFKADHPIVDTDIAKVPLAAIPRHDLLLAGFPCQPFSLAGVSKKNSLGRPHGFDCNTQGTLFFEVEKILRFHRPKAFLLENVKNLLSHDNGKTWTVIRHVLRDDLGYEIHTRVIDASPYVPQRRQRIFIVGFREPTAFDWANLSSPTRNQWPTLASILHPENGTEAPEPPYTDEKGRVNSRYVLSDHLWQYLQDYAAKHRERGNGFGFGLFGPQDIARTLSARYYKDGSEILIRRKSGNPRRLTPRECARLLGFDPPLGKASTSEGRFQIPVSDTQAYKQFGNSVVVPVIRAIATLMKPYLLGQGAAGPQLDLDLSRVRLVNG
jgi:DNA (cytosine-5)-methyltransferase 1